MADLSAIVKQPFTAPSADGIHTLQGFVYLPPAAPVGIFHAVHGMTEHIARYDTFLREMAADGWIACGYDHLGHGYTAKDASELGYFAPKNGWDLLARDVKGFSDVVRKAYGDTLPYVLMGHSMGSFIVRCAAEQYVRPDRLIIMGTGGRNPAAGAGLVIINCIKAFCGDHHVSPLVNRLCFGSYNQRFGGGTKEDPSPWLTTDNSVRARYYADPFCTFPFTVSAMGDLIRLTRRANRKAWFRSLPQDLPVLLVSGRDDPVGNYGKGVTQVAGELKKAGLPVQCILYDGARHEILNEPIHDRVVADIRAFVAPLVG